MRVAGWRRGGTTALPPGGINPRAATGWLVGAG